MATIQSPRGESHTEGGRRTFRVQFGDERLEYRDAEIEDPVPTGRQLLELANALPVKEHIAFHVLENGLLEELRDDETVDLRKSSGVERFLIFRSDRTFRFELDDRRYDWGAPAISREALLKLARVDSNTHSVWLDVPKGHDQEIAQGTLVSLTGGNTERFYTSPSKVTLIVNLDPKQWNQPRISYEEVTLLAFPDPPPEIVITYTVEYEGGPPANREGSMTVGDSVKVKDGMIFSVTETGRS
jgi:hypothetical protein